MMRVSVPKYVLWFARNMRRSIMLVAWVLAGQFSRAKSAALPYRRRLLKMSGLQGSERSRRDQRSHRSAHRDASEHTTVEYLDVGQLRSLDRPQRTDVTVLMPCIDASVGMKTAQLLATRAGRDCEILILDDTLRQGLVKTLNDTAVRISSRYVVYLAQDAYPGRDWLRRAYEAMEETGAGLLGFNDGKWYGRVASFGMVRMDWVRELYGGFIFYPGYKSHAADNELTAIARATGVYIYEPNCVLVELDPDWEAKKRHRNKNDAALFRERFASAFDGLASARSLAKIAKEYVRLPLDSPKGASRVVDS